MFIPEFEIENLNIEVSMGERAEVLHVNLFDVRLVFFQDALQVSTCGSSRRSPRKRILHERQIQDLLSFAFR
jgi:hypothetical protein